MGACWKVTAPAIVTQLFGCGGLAGGNEMCYNILRIFRGHIGGLVSPLWPAAAAYGDGRGRVLGKGGLRMKKSNHLVSVTSAVLPRG